MFPNSSSFLKNLLPGNVPVKAPTPMVSPTLNVKQPTTPGNVQNPFMMANDIENPNFMGYYGVNRPLKEPMFMGYRDDKPLYGGSRLFILY
ncbi:MAG: hypothetical protein K2X66_10840 [Cyanobacteria bacterium]|jgi:hypothetical protein|nr:hypothetical protein [Cyanobacteriota bacterium]